MRGYADFGRVDSFCAHFVYADEYDRDWIATMSAKARAAGIMLQYIDGDRIVASGGDLCNCVGEVLDTPNRPYEQEAWGPLMDDLVALSYQHGGVCLIVGNARSLFSFRERSAFKLVEIFQIQQHHWQLQGKPCDIYFQMDPMIELSSLLAGQGADI